MKSNAVKQKAYKKINVDMLLSSYEGLPQSMIQQALVLYLDEAKVFVSNIISAEGLDTQDVIIGFHNLKTMSAMIGAIDMMNLCKAYEICPKTTEKHALINQLDIEWQCLTDELHLLLQDKRFL